jgi:HK97 gp10 family phage protein
MLEMNVKLEGIDELFSHIDATKAKSIQRKALKAGGTLIQAAIAERAPERVTDSQGSNALPPGALKNDIEMKTLKGSDGNRIAISIGPGKYTAHVARFLEYGFHHYKLGKYIFRPFIRPAIDETESAAQKAILDTLESEIVKTYDSGTASADSGE